MFPKAKSLINQSVATTYGQGADMEQTSFQIFDLLPGNETRLHVTRC